MITDKTCQPDEFRNYFYLKLAPELNRYEKERKKRLITAVILTSIELILLLLLIYFTITYPLHDNRLVSLEWLAVIILLSLLIFTWVFIENNFEKEIKRNIMKSVCNSCFYGKAEYHEDCIFCSKSFLFFLWWKSVYRALYRGRSLFYRLPSTAHKRRKTIPCAVWRDIIRNQAYWPF